MRSRSSRELAADAGVFCVLRELSKKKCLGCEGNRILDETGVCWGSYEMSMCVFCRDLDMEAICKMHVCSNKHHGGQ